MEPCACTVCVAIFGERKTQYKIPLDIQRSAANYVQGVLRARSRQRD